MNFPDTDLSIPAVTEKDREDVKFAVELPILWLVALTVSESAATEAERKMPVPGANDGASGVALFVALGDALKKTPANVGVDLLFVDERPAGAQPPSAVDLAVTQTDPGLKGDTASGGGTKPATLETGVVIQVPLFIEGGEKVRVDTRSGEYVSRA